MTTSPSIPQSSYPQLRLRPEKEQILQHHHPWIFSGAVERMPNLAHGSLVYLTNSASEIIATGSYSNHGAIAVRVFAWEPATIDVNWLMARLRHAHQRRELLGLADRPEQSSRQAYRVVHGESDSLPGMTLDRYADVLVLQLTTAGMDHLRPIVLEAVSSIFPACSVVERSESAARIQEGLDEVSRVHRQAHEAGNLQAVQFEQDGLKLVAMPMSGQKTGFYLDQRDLRRKIRSFAHGRRVLNLFSYTGAHGMAAAAGGAVSVHHVDASQEALEGIQTHWEINGLATPVTTEADDIFQWLGRPHEQSYDMVILDPPALIKSHKDQAAGMRAYHFLNRAAMRLVAPAGLLVTSSCSQFFGEADLLTTVRRASLQNNRHADLIETVHQAADHPRSLYFPEGHYLTSLICQLS